MIMETAGIGVIMALTCEYDETSDAPDKASVKRGL
jgi:hypothetical protein